MIFLLLVQCGGILWLLASFWYHVQVCRSSLLLAEMYADTGSVESCPLVSQGKYNDRTYKRTDARSLYYTFRYTRPA